MTYRLLENSNLVEEEGSFERAAENRADAVVQDHDEGDSHDGEVHEGVGHDDQGAHEGEASHDDHEVDLRDMQQALGHYLDKDHLLGHVQDSDHFQVPAFNFKDSYHLKIPQVSPYTNETPMVEARGDFLGPVTFQPTKFVVLELMAALIVAALFITLGRKMRNGEQVKGRFWNMLEVVCVYVRDQIAKPAIGSHDAPRFLPFIWTIFFFVLAMNLLGMVPVFGAATGSISVTAALALCVFVVVVGTGMKKMGVVGFWKAQAPHMDLPAGMGFVLIPMIWVIEVFGLFVKHLVLAVRLFANMFAGHLVLAVFVAFIGVTWNSWLVVGVVPTVVGASVAIALLELLVAFIQAYVFAFLSALFIGAAIHPH